MVEQGVESGQLGSRARVVKRRKNISQHAFKPSADRWRYIADQFKGPPLYKVVEPNMCSNKFIALKAAYSAIRRVNQLTGGVDYWTMHKDQRKEAMKREKSLPLNFNHEVWVLCDEVIGSQQHVQYPGAADGNGMQERARERMHGLKRK